MAGEKARPIDAETYKAIDIIVRLLTDKEKETLAIKLNDQTITVFEQLCERGWDYVPIQKYVVPFRAQAAQILAANRRGIDFVDIDETKDFQSKLLDPENYKEVQSKSTAGKTKDKRLIDTSTDNLNTVKSIAKSKSGDAGLNMEYDYSSEWDFIDRQRLDNLKIERPTKALAGTETGQEDDTRGTDEEELPKPENVKDWISKAERLDFAYPARRSKDIAVAKFGDIMAGVQETEISLFDASISQGTNMTVADNALASNTFVDAVKRQGFLTVRDRIVLSEAIHSIHNVEFINTREKFFRLFDPLFTPVKRSCQ